MSKQVSEVSLPQDVEETIKEWSSTFKKVDNNEFDSCPEKAKKVAEALNKHNISKGALQGSAHIISMDQRKELSRKMRSIS